MVEAPRARVHHNHLVAGTRVRMIPVERPRGTRQFSASAKSRRQANDFLYCLYPRVRCIPTPRVDSVEQGHPTRLGKLLRRIAPGLEQGIGQQAIADYPPSQWAGQDSTAPSAVQVPIIGDIVVITNCIRSNVR